MIVTGSAVMNLSMGWFLNGWCGTVVVKGEKFVRYFSNNVRRNAEDRANDGSSVSSLITCRTVSRMANLDGFDSGRDMGTLAEDSCHAS